MGLRYSLIRTQRLVFSEADGYLTVADVRAHIESIAADPEFDPSYDHLFDLTEVADWKIAADQMHSLAKVRIFSPDSRRALVAGDDHVYGLLRMYESYRGGPSSETKIFGTRLDALAWLGRPTNLEPEKSPGSGDAAQTRS